MYEFKASIIGGQNVVFRPVIKIDDYGVTFKIPGIFSGKEQTVDFDSISSVSISGNMITKDIVISTMGYGRIVAEGFSSSDAKEVKRLIEDAKQQSTADDEDDDDYDEEPRLTPAEQLEYEKNKLEIEKNKLELEYLEKEKSLQWENRLKAEKAEEQQKILNDNRRFGRIMIFWKYTLNKTWKKIIFVGVLLTILNYLFVIISDGLTYYSDKEKLESQIQYLRDNERKLDSLITVKQFDQAELIIDEITKAERSLGTDNRFLKKTYLDFSRELNWLGGFERQMKIDELRTKKK